MKCVATGNCGIHQAAAKQKDKEGSETGGGGDLRS